MSEQVQRIYTGSDAAMIVAISTIIGTSKDHQVKLNEVDSSITVTFLEDIDERVDLAAHDILGADNAGELRKATANVITDHTVALKEFGLLKIVIENKLGNDKPRLDEVLTHLGFTAHYAKAAKENQEAMGELLFQFDKNLDAALELDLVALGLPTAKITVVRNIAIFYNKKNVNQELQKRKRIGFTAEDVTTLNGLYSEVIAICKIGQKIFSAQPAIHDGFVYSKVLPGNHNSHNDGPNPGTTE